MRQGGVIMTYQIAHAEKFPLELGEMPKKVRNAYKNNLYNVLKYAPNQVNPPKIKRLNDFNYLWRLRLGDDYRLVYRVDEDKGVVTMLMIGHRKKIYQRLKISDEAEPSHMLVGEAEDYIERKNASGVGHSPKLERLLPVKLKRNVLAKWGVPSKYHGILENVRTENDLLGVNNVPDKVIERIIERLWPSDIDKIFQDPVRIASHPEEIEEAADGKRSIESFLLMLDEEQEEFLTRFRGNKKPQGPWLLKGGPGSGKSTISLYCIRELLNSLQQLSIFEQENRPLKILYTTFTNSLVNVSEYLLEVLDISSGPHELEVKTVDSLASRHLPREWQNKSVCFDYKEREELVCEAVDQCKMEVRNYSFSHDDKKFLLEEIDWIIIGQDLENVDQYLELGRSGRGRALGHRQRQHLWKLYESLQNILRERNECFFSERLRAAAKSVSSSYDYVFIDEAQDLKPVAVRFLMGLCHNRRNVFLTADINQSIWGYSFSWTKMASDLRVQGRTKVLRRNYRTTKEIWNAVLQLAPSVENADKETLSLDAVYRGVKPVLSRYCTSRQAEERLNSFLFEALRKERASLGNAAVLCPTNRETEKVYEMLDERFKPKIMKSKDVDISWPGVKILTMHAAKGLEFPVVAIFCLEKNRLPWPARDGIDREDHFAQQQRLLFVACSRAMRRLIVFAQKDRPSVFLKKFTDEYWDVEDL